MRLRLVAPDFEILLQLEAGANPIAGSVLGPDGSRWPFVGYMSLISTLEDMRGAGVGDDSFRASADDAGEDGT